MTTESRCEHGVDFSEFCSPCAHHPIEEWVGYPMTICAFCQRSWPCEFMRERANGAAS